MFSSKRPSWIDQLREKLTKYVDERFEDYRGQIAMDLARGLASLAGIVAIWTLAIVCTIFVAITLSLLIGTVLSIWIGRFGYVISFMSIAAILLGTAYHILKHKEQYIEKPVFKVMSDALRNPETWGIDDKEKTDSKKEETPPKKETPPTPKENLPKLPPPPKE